MYTVASHNVRQCRCNLCDCTRHRKRGFLSTCSETERDSVLVQNYKNCNDSKGLPTLSSAAHLLAVTQCQCDVDGL